MDEETLDIDARMTFDSFVVGPANRLASAAARRVAESPGTSYNPLFMYAASGLGKSHLLGAIAHRATQANPDASVVYQTLEGFLDEMTGALAEGGQDAMRARYQQLDVLLLDDVQFLTGQTQAQELLLRTVDALTLHGGQVVLASDRPPAEINGLDSRLLSRFSGGLIVDIATPDFETRVAIVRRKAQEQGGRLDPGVSEAVGRIPFRNVRELQGALNRLLAVQELEERPIREEDVERVVGRSSARGEDGPGALDGAESGVGAGLSSALEVEQGNSPAGMGREEPWRRILREAAESGEREGLSALALRRHLDGSEPPDDPEGLAREFLGKVERIGEIRRELQSLGDPWPEAANRILSDPDRLEEAEGLLVSARERTRPFPSIPDGASLDECRATYPPLAVQAARRMVERDRPDVNPVFLVSTDEDRALTLLGAAGRAFRERRPEGEVALVSLDDFSEDYIRAISDGVAGAWRERWWSLDLLLIHGMERLSGMERAQEEFFHLFEALKRRDARMILVADRSPDRLEGVGDRLRSRFEGGLLVPLDEDPAEEPSSAQPPTAGGEGPDESPQPEVRDPTPPGLDGPPHDLSVIPAEEPVPGATDSGISDGTQDPSQRWEPGTEKVVWRWPRLEERIVEDGP